MSKVSLGGSATGTATFDIVAPATNTNRTITLPDTSGQVSVLDLRAAQTASGTAVDFLNIPATARRITVMFNGVSTNGTSFLQTQLGSGSVQVSGYAAGSTRFGSTALGSNNAATGFIHNQAVAADVVSGSLVLSLVGGNTWACSFSLGITGSGTSFALVGGGSVTLSGPLDRIRITTVNGTDTFDAGSISILVE